MSEKAKKRLLTLVIINYLHLILVIKTTKGWFSLAMEAEAEAVKQKHKKKETFPSSSASAYVERFSLVHTVLLLPSLVKTSLNKLLPDLCPN